MPYTPNRNYYYPAKGTKPYFTEIEQTFTEIDADMQAIENSVAGGGGLWTEFETTGLAATGNADTVATTNDAMVKWAFLVTRTDIPGNMAQYDVSCCVDHSASSVEYKSEKTTDIGDTSGITFSVDHDGSNARLRATITDGTWTVTGASLAVEV